MALGSPKARISRGPRARARPGTRLRRLLRGACAGSRFLRLLDPERRRCPCPSRCTRRRFRPSGKRSARSTRSSPRRQCSPKSAGSTRRCCSAGGWRPTCSRSPARSRSRPTTPRAAAPASPGPRCRKWPDDETTFAALRARIARTLDFVQSFAPDAIDGSEERAIALTAGTRELRFTGQQYLVGFALPNFYFHATTAYAILRHCGLPLGKRDFLAVS